MSWFFSEFFLFLVICLFTKGRWSYFVDMKTSFSDCLDACQYSTAGYSLWKCKQMTILNERCFFSAAILYYIHTKKCSLVDKIQHHPTFTRVRWQKKEYYSPICKQSHWQNKDYPSSMETNELSQFAKKFQQKTCSLASLFFTLPWKFILYA